MVQTDKSKNRLNTRRPKFASKPINNKGANNIPSEQSLLSKYLSKGAEVLKNIFISAYDQRKLSFGNKLKIQFGGFMNFFNIVKIIFYCIKDGKSATETIKELFIYIAKVFSGSFFCHITTSLMEALVKKFLKTSIGIKLAGLIAGCLGCPAAPVLLFAIDILISYLGGKLIDLIIFLYNKYLKQYVERAWNWVKEKAKKAWNWVKDKAKKAWNWFKNLF